MNDIGIKQIHTAPSDKIVAYFSTRNLYNVLPAAYNSLLAHTPNLHVYCFIEDDKLPFKTPANVTCVNVSKQKLFRHDGPCYRTQYTYMILLKAALTKIFSDADKALILDVDTIVCDDLTPLWNMVTDTAYFSAVVEPEGSRIRGVPYANFGVVMLNLAKLRTSGVDDDIINELNSRMHLYPEQDAFSLYCGNRFDPLPPDYNVTKYGFNITGTPSRTIVHHFAGIKDWSALDIVQYWLTHTTPPPRYVVYAGDRRIRPMLSASAKSLLAHTTVDKIFFLIDSDTFYEDLPPVIETINVSNQTIFPLNGPNIMPWYSYMTTLRAGLTRILPPYVERVLWLDPDTIVCDDISDLWNTDIQYKYFAAVEEVRNHNHTLKPYFNAGVMLMNLKKMAEDGKATEIIDAINTTPYEHLEQDALNYLCHLHIRKLPSCYSDSYVSEPCDHPRIKHFLARAKPQFEKEAEPYKNTPWNQLKGVIEYAERQADRNGSDRSTGNRHSKEA